MATMSDIAASLGISKATVSKALSGSSDISESTRIAVIERAVELGYTRIQRSRELPRLCVFVMHMEHTSPDDFGYEIILGFRQLAEPMGFAVDIIDLDEETQLNMTYDEYMLRSDYRGAFFLGVNNFDPWIGSLRVSRTPTVLFDNPSFQNAVLTQISVDNTEAMELAVAHLWELGHRRIGYLSSGPEESYIYQQRRSAFLSAMQTRHAAPEDMPTAMAPYTSGCIHDHLPTLLKAGCTAIMCNHDVLAHAVLVACSELGIRVPDELSIVGFDDIPICEHTRPPLTTIRQNRIQLGKSAFYALNSQIEHTPISLLMLHAELVVRGSTGERV